MKELTGRFQQTGKQDGSIWMELKSRTEAVEEILKTKYRQKVINNRVFFVTEDDNLFSLDFICEYNAIVVEYADSQHDAEKNCLEDGNLFYVEEMTTDEIVKAIIEEVCN